MSVGETEREVGRKGFPGLQKFEFLFVGVLPSLSAFWENHNYKTASMKIKDEKILDALCLHPFLSPLPAPATGQPTA